MKKRKLWMAVVLNLGMAVAAMGFQDDTDREAVLKKLATVRISLHEKDQTLGAIVEKIRKAGDLYIVIARAVESDFKAGAVTFNLDNVSLATALKLTVQDKFKVIYKEKVLIITTRDAAGTDVMELVEAREKKEKAREALTPELKKKIDGWIRDLESGKIKVRDEASKELMKTGEPARGPLEEAAKSKNPEVRARAQRALSFLGSYGDLEIMEKLRNTKVTMRFEHTPLPAFIEAVHTYISPVTIHIQVEEADAVLVNIDLKNISVENLLNLVLLGSDLGFFIKEGTVIIDHRENISSEEPKPVVEIDEPVPEMPPPLPVEDERNE